MRRSPLTRLTPPQLIALSFALASLLGAGLLSLPITHQPGKQLDFVQALFMSTSALCVAGLGVVDPGSTFNTLGQVVLLSLIQIGGLGIITFGTLFSVLLGRRINFAQRIRLAQQVSAFGVGGVVPLIRKIFVFTLLAELLGTALLAIRFVPQEGWGRGLYFALFHAVSAFNNVGFSLYPDNLMRFVNDPLICLVISALIILGGMGFAVQINVLAHWRRPRTERLLVHSKIVLSVMAALLLIGTLLILLFEHANPATLGPLPWGSKILASFFQSVVARTGGFNTLDYSLMALPTLFITIILMFIGANPGSTGGGIKTSTFYVMLTSALTLVRGRGDPVTFQRRIHRDTVIRAMTVGLLSLGLVNTGLLLMLWANTSKQLSFVSLFFETVSAFASVGVSMNATPLLNSPQQLILIALMYLGRIGPLTFAVAIGDHQEHQLIKYPPERDILIG
ncbi:TrkH family potassium uptake protein [Deinococcus sp.]|uniref:TrkH family potassium uptake protein n=1 Tax=Deinococcus sp. TaxID=47478 RepID=UPI0025F33B2C|nr:TrkH family potassium uptake protein [Deinococcus sp.]